MTREQKIKKDSKALKEYRKRLKNERMRYSQSFEAYSVNQRRSRALAIGECVLQAREAIYALRKRKPLINGTLFYNVSEQKVVDPDGKRGFHCVVTFAVNSEEPAHEDGWIEKEIAETFEKMMRETDEMFPPEEEKKDETEKSAERV